MFAVNQSDVGLTYRMGQIAAVLCFAKPLETRPAQSGGQRPSLDGNSEVASEVVGCLKHGQKPVHACLLGPTTNKHDSRGH